MKLSLDEALRRSRELAPRLAARAEESHRLRRLPQDTVDALHQAGLFRILQPARVGGGELDYVCLVQVGAALARGCASAAWTLTNLASHHWMLAKFPARAQADVWDADLNALIAASFIFPAGRAHASKGGYVLSGRWPYCSGVGLAGWVMLGAIVGGEVEDDPAEYRLFLLPRSDYRIHETWETLGLEGTGSHDVEVENAFVPGQRTLAVDATKGGDTPGSALNPGALYRIPLFATFPYVFSGIALGIAEAAVEHFIDTARGKTLSYQVMRLADSPSIQVRLAEASAYVDAARTMMVANCTEVQRLAQAGQVPDILSKVRYRRDAAVAVTFCARAVDLLFKAGGGRAVYLRNPLQRSFRDVSTVQAHIAFNFDIVGAAYGRVALGQMADNPTL